MMNWLLKKFLGGKSKTNEFAFFVFLLYVAGLAGVFGVSAFLSYRGVDHDFALAVEVIKFLTPWVLVPVFSVFGLGKIGSFGFFGSARQSEFAGRDLE